MHHYITPALLVDLFAGQPANDPTFIGITEPAPLDGGIEAIGITFGPVRFVVFFAVRMNSSVPSLCRRGVRPIALCLPG